MDHQRLDKTTQFGGEMKRQKESLKKDVVLLLFGVLGVSFKTFWKGRGKEFV